MALACGVAAGVAKRDEMGFEATVFGFLMAWYAAVAIGITTAAVLLATHLVRSLRRWIALLRTAQEHVASNQGVELGVGPDTTRWLRARLHDRAGLRLRLLSLGLDLSHFEGPMRVVPAAAFDAILFDCHRLEIEWLALEFAELRLVATDAAVLESVSSGRLTRLRETIASVPTVAGPTGSSPSLLDWERERLQRLGNDAWWRLRICALDDSRRRYEEFVEALAEQNAPVWARTMQTS